MDCTLQQQKNEPGWMEMLSALVNIVGTYGDSFFRKDINGGFRFRRDRLPAARFSELKTVGRDYSVFWIVKF
jgi:hypothetical protein